MKNRSYYLLLQIFIFAFYKCTKTTDVHNDDKINNIAENYYKERMQLFPFEAQANGINDYNDRFPIDISQTFRDSLGRFAWKIKAQLGELKNKKLGDNAQITSDILNWENDRIIESLKFPDNLSPINQFWGKTIDLGQLGSGESAQPFKTKKDYENWLARMSHFPAWCDTAISNMRKGMAYGWVLPKSLVVKMLPQFQTMAETPTDTHVYYGPIDKLETNKDIFDSDKIKLTADYVALINNNIKPNHKKIYDFLKNEYLSAARPTSGFNAVPNGRAYYDFLIKYWTTTDLSADQVFDIGQKEVARIRAEMEKVKTSVGFKGDLKAFFKFVNTDNKSLTPFTQPAQVLSHFDSIYKKMQPQLEKLFDKKPKTHFEIRRTETFREVSASAEYIPGNLESDRAGIFYVPLPDVKKYNIFQDESLFLHEAIPGHHYQGMLQSENKSLPSFRRYLWYGAYGEGWALYCEGLGKDLGLYTDPYQYFGRLGAEMHRAIRLVVDVGLHAKNWTREKAIQYDLDNEAESVENVTAEIERYMAIPGQALSYKIGEQKILELKHKAQVKLGDKFDIRAFHDEVLSDGCVPLEILEKKIIRRFGL